MLDSVKFNDVDMYEKYGFILATKTIGPAEPQTKYVDVPQRNGSIDLTESLTGSVKYSDRTITMTFVYLGDKFTDLVSKFSETYHGQKVKIIFDDDLNYYYEGRLEIKSTESRTAAKKISVSATCEPIKYDVISSLDDWLWDPFDFEGGIINYVKDVTISGTTEVMLICRRDWEFPTFMVDSAMTLEYKGSTYDIPAGEHKNYLLFLSAGENTFQVTGNGTLSINYRGGSL